MPRALTIPIAAGSEPELIEIDDAREAIGEIPPDTCEDSLFDLIAEDLAAMRRQKRKKEKQS